MKIFRKHLLLYTLLTLFSGNIANKPPSYDGTLTQNEDFSQNDDTINYRLPTDVKPFLYDLKFIPNFDNFTFMGIAQISVQIERATNNITLHVGNIEIEAVSVITYASNDHISTTYDNITEKYTIILPKTLEKNRSAEIYFTYHGTLNDNMIGFYRSSYYDENEIKWLAATQFQTTHARHAFPCFDEPSFKAKFMIRISRDENYMTLSNMKLNRSDSLVPGKIWDVYEESVPMSTYLVAFVVADKEFKPFGENSFKVWSKPSTIDQAEYALNFGKAILELFEKKFNEKYTLEKMDMVAIPDFAAGAMENWGLVTYRESRMLYDKEESSALAEQSVASVIAHELTHMWFGNLVTPEWWSCLWLSEGFATYFEYFGTAELKPGWNMKEQFVVEQHQSALIADGLESSLPMTREVSNKSQIAGIGDTITYNKGASIIRMMSLLFGNDIFEASLNEYIQNNKENGLGHPDALWEAVKNQVFIKYPTLKAEVKIMMDTWTTQAGYPVVSVNINDNGILNIAQERFFLRNLDNTPIDIIWSVPLTFATQSKPDFDNLVTRLWLSTKESSADFKIDANEWVIFNVQSSGFYRVNYNKRGWKNIFNFLKNGNLDHIHVLNRAAIVDDVLNLARAGYQSYDMALDGLLYLQRETNYLPFKAAFNGLEYLNKRFTRYGERLLFKMYVLSLLENINFQLGYEDREGESRLTVLLRREVNNWLCNLDDDDCVTIYTDKFKQWRTDGVRIKPNERTTAYCVAMRHGTPEDWDFLWNKYNTSNHATDQTVILNALGCSQNTTILEKYLGYAIINYETSQIRKQDSTSVFAAVYNSGMLGAECVLDFVENNYKEMEKYYGGLSTVATILHGASQRFSTNDLVNKFEKLIYSHEADFMSIQKSLESSLRIAKYEMKWYNVYSTSIIQWLQAYDNSRYRLPTNIIPQRYDIFVTPDLETGNFTFDGKVTIEADVIQPTSQIILHSSEITHHDVKVTANLINLNNLKKKVIKQYDLLVIYLRQEVNVGTKLTIEIKYTGNLDATELRGFYKSSYIDDNGEPRWLAASHLEPVGARKMFPCFDEPALKAKFTIHVGVPPDYGAISNMEWQTSNKSDNRMVYSFFETVPMSTYLVAVIISDFKDKTIKTDGTTLSVYARPNAISQAEYALSVMPSLLNYFWATYNMKYHLSKLDMAALPDFPSGAMENWGLLTYRETSMLYDENHSPITNKQDIRNVIAHEISHQWFGNLVSPKWWKYLWLNEGFARYFQYHAPARVFGDKTMEPQFVVDQVHSAFSADSSNSTHPMSHDVTTPREIRNIFDTITYSKGASVLRMIEKTYGTNLFDKALSDYLEKKKYDVAMPEDLYASLQQKVNEDGLTDNIKIILDTWTTQPGYPIVNVYVIKDFIILKQERFFLKKHENNSSDIKWHIPITWASIQNSLEYFNTTPKLWLTEKMTKIPNPGSLLIFNMQQSGYYRVNYNKNWKEVINYLKNQDIQTIHEINRAGLIDDLMNLARADYIDYKTVISAMTYLEKENSYYPWRAFFNNLPYLNNRFAGRDIEDLYKKWLTSLIEQRYIRLGFEDQDNDDDLTQMFRIHTRKWACKLNIADCTYQATKYFQEKQHSKMIPPNYRDVVYCTAMRMDETKNTYNFLWKEYLESNVTTDKLVILSSLACSKNKDVLERLLRDAVTENSQIRYQDSAKVFSNVYDESLIGVEVVMKVIEKYYDDILHRHFNDYTKIASIVNALASRLSTYDLYNQYQKLLDWLVNKEPEFKKSINSYLATAEYEFDWYENKVPVIFETLDKLFSTNTYRLPKTLYPKEYTIKLKPYMEEGVFEGNTAINVIVREDTTLIVLNSHNLDILNITVTRNGAPIELLNYTEHISQQLKIYLSEYIRANEEILVEIKYNGTLNDNMNGFYRSSYLDINGVQHWLATTHFEPTYARQAFPCFDEPEFKSEFTIHIQRSIHYNSLSNMPHMSVNQNPENGYTWDIFQTSVNMSTYLVAVIVSDFKNKTIETDGTTLSVYARPNAISQAEYALSIMPSLLNYFGTTYNLKYHLSKLDMAALPDFPSGAMENWGLLTYRETSMLYDENHSPITNKQDIRNVIAHEISHQWFGNLVSPKWWKYLWLNEGFARYFQYHAPARVFGDKTMEPQFVVDQVHSAFSADSSNSTHPLSHDVTTPREIRNIFDTITYSKGASVLRMVEKTYGTNLFDKALSDYLEKKKYDVATPEDLYASLQQKVNENGLIDNIKIILDTWTTQPGYPIVNVDVINDSIILKQERFFLKKHENNSNDIKWHIPITWASIQNSLEYFNTTPKLWLTEKMTKIPNSGSLLIFNMQQSGYYRVNYNKNWKEVINYLKNQDIQTIHEINRAGLIDDLMNLARADYIDYKTVISAMTYLEKEDSYYPWRAFFNNWPYLNNRFAGRDIEGLYKKWLKSLIEQRYTRLGFEDQDNDDLTQMFRIHIRKWACKLDIADCIYQATKYFQEKQHSKMIPPNYRDVVYCTAMRMDKTKNTYNFLWKEYLESNVTTDKLVILNSLACSENKDVLETLLRDAVTENSQIRYQDSAKVFSNVYDESLIGVEVVMKVIEKYYDDILHRHFNDYTKIASIVNALASRLSTYDLYNQYQKLLDWLVNKEPEFKKSINSYLATAEYEFDWYENKVPVIFETLDKLFSTNTYRLPKTLYPKEYTIKLKPYMEEGVFEGNTAINVIVRENTTLIVLNSHNLDILNITVTRNGAPIELLNYTEHISQQLKIYLSEYIRANEEILVEIKYNGTLNDNMNGFYRSSYLDINGVQHWLATTHFEPTYARQAFPCFDEPEFKSKFTIHIQRSIHYNSLSNMPHMSVNQNPENGYTWDIFQTSVNMSTYLVAVIVSDFKNKTIETDGTTLSVYARPNAISQAEYALSVMPSLLDYFGTTYNMKYHLSKLDMAALPDFPSGAMENWGLLTYRETSMLYDENHSPITNKQDIRNVIAHEISHQWFGNLVSPKWWKYLWLNEGFARYFQYHAPARVFGDKTMEPQFVVDQVHSAFSADSSNSTHPMSHDVTTPREIQNIFDTITYSKGASVLRMIEKTYGTNLFDKALSDYLEKKKYDVATPEDLYASLQQKVNENGLIDNIKIILDTWTIQPGYPIVNVDVINDSIILKQERFFLKKHENNSNDIKWHIPITWASIQNSLEYSNTTPKLWLTEEMTKIPNPGSLLIFNTQQSGYYRVNYNKNWKEVINYLKNQDIQTIHEINRAGLIDDLMNLARADYIDYKTVISAMTYLEKEDSYYPWRAFFNNLPYLNNRFAGRDIEGLYKKWLKSLIEQRYTRLGFEDQDNDDDLTQMFRIHIRKWACKLDIADCIYQATKYFQEKQHSKMIPPNYRDVIYCTAMRMDKTKNTYNFLWKEYLESNVTTDKLVILSSLACSENKDVLETLLWDAVTENSQIRYQDSAKVFSNVYDESLIGVEVVMKVIEKYYDDILHRHFNDYTKIASIVNALASRLSTYDLYNQYQKLLDWLVNKEPEFKKSINSYLATAEYEFDWYENKVPVIFETLDKLFSTNTYRLPKTLYPKEYTIKLKPYMEEGVFEGNTAINVIVREDTTLIVLNSHNLDILNITVTRNGAPIELLNYTEHISQQLKIYLSEYIRANEEILVEIKYNGTLNDNMNGFYRSSYLDINGVQHWLATTHFEPTYARQAFPCFDEPEFKSKFTIHMQRSIHYNSLSNMPHMSVNQNPENGYTWDIFQTSSVNMSTYLVAFVVSEFKSVHNLDNVTLNVWGRPEVVPYATYAQDIGIKIINELENITNIKYALPKLDLVGIPDFEMGAMENWGLATFREYGLFYNKEETISTYEKSIITVIAHELTHMWFGNLVTCDWWEYIWLNEGFAEYFEWFISDRIHPEYKFMDQFVVYELQPALSKDASLSAHPMTNPVTTPEEIADIFDYVTYGKSASVLRMIFNAFDEEAHILALRDYLEKRKYLTARPTDLWESFESFVSISIGYRNVSIEEIMNTWTDQPGYPVVNVTLNGSILTLTQERFLMNRNTPGNEFYWIPIDIFVPADLYPPNTGVQLKRWLGSESSDGIPIIINPINDWYIVNYKQTGFYRVNYDTASWKALIHKLTNKGFEAIHVLNRAQIIDDLFNLARANYVEYELLMNASMYLEQETNHLPWKAFFNGLSYIYERFEQGGIQTELTKYVLNLLSNMYKKVGFVDREDDEYLDKLDREMILQWACKLNKDECVQTSVNLFAAWRKNSSERISPNARPAVYCTALKNGTADDWEFLWNKYLETNFATEKKIIINALGCSINETVLQNYLEKAIAKYDPATAKIRRQDVSAVFTSVYSAGPIGLNVTIDFLIKNMEALYQYFGEWNEIANLFVNVASHTSNKDQYNKLVYLIEHYVTLYPPNIKAKMISALTTAETNLLWYINKGPKIRDWIMQLEATETQKEKNSSTRIELNIVFMTFVALISYFLSY